MAVADIFEKCRLQDEKPDVSFIHSRKCSSAISDGNDVLGWQQMSGLTISHRT
jgi:hypothetical protein